jgi:hypothetical protein
MSFMDPTKPWTPITGEKVQPEPYPLDLPFGETIQSCPILEPGSSICGISEEFFCQTASSHVQIGDWISNCPGEGQQYSHQEFLDTQAGSLTFGFSDTRPALPQILAAQPGLDPSEQFLGVGSIYPLLFHCLWPSCKARTRSFLLSTDLAHHVHTYHLHRCPWPTCSIRKPFRRRSDLNRHLASVHTGSRKHRCDVPGCEKAYSRSDKLTAHKRIHGNHMAPTASSVPNPGTLHIAALAPLCALASTAGMVDIASSTSIHDIYSADSACPSVPPFLDFWMPFANPKSGHDTLQPATQDYQSSLPPYPSVNHAPQQESDLPFSPDSLATRE